MKKDLAAIITAIYKFGDLSYTAGVYEREPDSVERSDAAAAMFQEIVRMLHTKEGE